MRDLLLGWDVGAWNCDQNRKSRDALCALEIRGSEPTVVGKVWRGNLRNELVAHEGLELVNALLKRVEVASEAPHHLTVAIDTPLAWPKRMLDLVATGQLTDVPSEADGNPYLFRSQELALFKQGRRPLSVVRDMIGSQSTKGIHFLRKARLMSSSVGTWSRQNVVAIETYPAAAAQDAEIARLTHLLLTGLGDREKQQRGSASQADVRDAITCGLVAWLHRTSPTRLEAPSETAEVDEGWIWLPRNSPDCGLANEGDIIPLG